MKKYIFFGIVPVLINFSHLNFGIFAKKLIKKVFADNVFFHFPIFWKKNRYVLIKVNFGVDVTRLSLWTVEKKGV